LALLSRLRRVNLGGGLSATSLGCNLQGIIMMKHYKKTKLFIGFLLLILFTVLPYQLLWGKLFPYSPVKLGFEKFEFSNIVVYVQDGSETYNYKSIDSLIPSVEKFHKLNFVHKPEIIFFRDSINYCERTITKARYFAYPNGSVVISPWAVREALNNDISMEIYLKHELSHTLLYEHMDFITAYIVYPRWLLEGIAVYSSNQMGTSWYPSKKNTYQYIAQGSFLEPEYFNTKKEDEAKLDVKYKTAFAYSEFACIVDYLIENYGKDKFYEYMGQLLDSWQPEEVFKDVYGINFNTCLNDFKQYVKGHNY
jgi:predicted SprT family Zn-dependent metalloprotease